MSCVVPSLSSSSGGELFVFPWESKAMQGSRRWRQSRRGHRCQPNPFTDPTVAVAVTGPLATAVTSPALLAFIVEVKNRPRRSRCYILSAAVTGRASNRKLLRFILCVIGETRRSARVKSRLLPKP